MGLFSSDPQRPHRGWDTPLGVVANIVIGLVIAAVAVGNIVSGKWQYVVPAVAVLIGFGVLPAMAAWKDGHFFGRHRSAGAVDSA